LGQSTKSLLNVVSLNIDLVDCFDIADHCNLIEHHPDFDFDRNFRLDCCHHHIVSLVNCIDHLMVLGWVQIKIDFLLIVFAMDFN